MTAPLFLCCFDDNHPAGTDVFLRLAKLGAVQVTASAFLCVHPGPAERLMFQTLEGIRGVLPAMMIVRLGKETDYWGVLTLEGWDVLDELAGPRFPEAARVVGDRSEAQMD